jgi:redox-sensitive bicupin YhaK (pirin superfamily)
VLLKVIAGEAGGVRGPIAQPATDPFYVDVHLAAGAGTTLAVPPGHRAFAYVYDGAMRIAGERLDAGVLAILGDGDALALAAAVEGGTARAIVVAGRPLREPIARMGPFVMNTKAEILEAIADYQAGRF